ncbi:MAG: acyltransferase [Clostridiales bacterium]|nr:acyltransferase [Clostridiales bacterium]
MYGIGIRYALLKSIARECGDNVSIHQGCFILYPEKLSLGSHVSIHPMCYIEAVGGLCIGDNVSLAHAVTVLSATHHYKDRNIPIKDQGISELPAKICDNVWVGAKATILGGRNIGSGSVIAAGAVVTHDVEPNTVVAGVPASFLMER